MRGFRFLPLILAVFFPLITLVFVHQVAKLPDEPWLAGLPEMFGNLAFAVALGLSLPVPRLFAVLILVAAAGSGIWLGRRLRGR